VSADAAAARNTRHRLIAVAMTTFFMLRLLSEGQRARFAEERRTPES
jgi:hypothetical protein